jgi:hypothetical protein
MDSIKARISPLEKNFIPDKAEFDRYVKYIHKNQLSRNSALKPHIKIEVDEKGSLFLTSFYYGKDVLHHTGLRVYDGDAVAKTDSIPVGNIDNYQGNSFGLRWERVIFRNGHDNGVIEFIAKHSDHQLKVVFSGKGRNYIILNEADKKAIRDAYELSCLIKTRERLMQEIKGLQG